MPNFNQELQDKLTHHALRLERLKKGAFRRYLPILKQIDAIVLGLFAQSWNGTTQARREFVVELRKLKTKVFAEFENELIAELENLSKRQASFTFEVMAGMLTDAMLNKSKPPKVSSIESRGMKVKQQIDHLRNQSIRNTIIATGSAIADGLTLSEATARLRRTSRKEKAQARAVMATMIASVATDADKSVMMANKDIIKGVKLSVVFDNRTTPICIQHSIDDRLYPVDNYPQPPFHFNCRTRAMPVVKSWSELGANMRRRVPVGTRASMTGTTTIDKTYSQWLKRQSKEIQIDALGERRAELFRSGKLTLDKFIDPTGKYYTIDELFSKYDI